MLFKALAIAFGMYSKIPVPRVKWEEKNMRYALCFFPAIGCVIGAVIYFAGIYLRLAGIGSLLYGCIMSVIPVFITGGIHLDGFLDTMDAISSYADREKRLEILKDSNSGAFAVIGGIVYFVLSVGFWSEVSQEMLGVIAVGYTMSRALSGLGVVCFPKAKNTGLVNTFNEGADKRVVKLVLGIVFCLFSVLAVYLNTAGGSAAAVVALLCFVYHYFNCKKNFGGITGDLAGYFLQLCELLILITVVVVYKGMIK